VLYSSGHEAVSREEFEALKKRVAALEDIVEVLEQSQTAVLQIIRELVKLIKGDKVEGKSK
jgi:hypothetical protein